MSKKDNIIELDTPSNMFKGIYICFKEMIIGFITWCRLVIDSEGYFFKGSYARSDFISYRKGCK